jgi:hypothetical protein
MEVDSDGYAGSLSEGDSDSDSDYSVSEEEEEEEDLDSEDSWHDAVSDEELQLGQPALHAAAAADSSSSQLSGLLGYVNDADAVSEGE